MDKEHRQLINFHPDVPQWFQATILGVEISFGSQIERDRDMKESEDGSNKEQVESTIRFRSYFERRDETESLNPYEFFKFVLEQETQPFGYEQELFELMGIKRDFSSLSNPVKITIAAQCLAQVLLYLSNGKLVDRDILIQLVKNAKNLPWDFNVYTDQIICKWVKKIFPDLKGRSRGRPSKYKSISVQISVPNLEINILRPVPGIFVSDDSINFVKLRFVLQTLSLILKSHGWSLQPILNCPLVAQYSAFLPCQFYMSEYIKDWVRESYG